MKKWYVYELVNLMGTVEYVGETQNPKKRIYNHKSKYGKFTARADIFMNIIKEFNNKKDAYEYQCIIQNEYGFLSDRDISYVHSANQSKPINVYFNGKIIGEYRSYTQARKQLGFTPRHISSHVSNNIIEGYYFEYKNKNSID